MTITPGTSVGGNYRIIAPLGSGNFGQAYLAEDSRARNRKCVVKKFNFSNSNQAAFNKAKELFEREAEFLYKLSNSDQNHYIPQFFASFDEGQEFYLVEEWIQGQTLSEELQQKHRLTEDEIVDLLNEVLEILKFIHSQGVIHRDIKPENLMRRNQNDKIVLIDFGAVKEMVAQSTNTAPSIKMTMIYTEWYAPPEQRQGMPQYNSDIYALGITALELLTGLEPENLKNSKTGEIIWPSTLKISAELAKILEKMVDENYNRRYQTAEDVLKELNQKTVIVSPKYVSNHGSSPTILGKTFIKPGILFIIAAPVVIIMFLGMSFSFVRLFVTPPKPEPTSSSSKPEPTLSPPKPEPTLFPSKPEPTSNPRGSSTPKNPCPPILPPGKRC
jgi:serine/threonine-protein kinase